MRDFKGMKRQRSRNRNGGAGGGGKPQQNANRAFESNGPDGVKVRGAAQHVYEKYMQLARDATMSGDRVLAENYQQHAEHYFRLIRTMQPQRPVADILGRDQFVSGFDIDFEEEPQAEILEGEGEGEVLPTESVEGVAERPFVSGRRDEFRRDERREDFRRDDRRDYEPRVPESRGGEARDFRGEGRRDDSRRDDGRRDDGRREEGRREDGRGEWRGRDGGSRFERGERPAQSERGGAGRGDRGFNDRGASDAGPRRDERPRYGREDRSARYEAEPAFEEPSTDAPAPVLRAEDGDVSHAPAFLQARPVEAEKAPERRPRRRRTAAGSEPGPKSGAESGPEYGTEATPESGEG